MTRNVGETNKILYIGVIGSEEHPMGFLEMHFGHLKEQNDVVLIEDVRSLCSRVH